MKFIHILIFLFVSISLPAQINQTKAFQLVLEGDEIGKEYTFSKRAKDLYDSLILVYLGEITTDKKRVLKILTSRWYWGSSPRATSRIIIFNQQNQYIGDYYLTMNYDIPKKIEDRSLVFFHMSPSECDPTLITRISFKKGIPKRFFLKCKGKQGDFYSFSQNL